MTPQNNFKFISEQNRILHNIYDEAYLPFKRICFDYQHEHRSLALPEIYKCFEDKLKDFKTNLWNTLYVFPGISYTDAEAQEHIEALQDTFNTVIDSKGNYPIEALTGKYKAIAEETMGIILEFSFIPKEL